MKRAFSLLEIIFVIAITSIVLSYLFKNSILFLDSANLTKIKTEVSLIRTALNTNKNSNIMLKEDPYPNSLDSARINVANENLFGGTSEQKLLTVPLVSTSSSKKQIGSFIKLSSNKYAVYISKNELIEFEYDKNDGTFNCISNEELCRKIN